MHFTYRPRYGKVLKDVQASTHQASGEFKDPGRQRIFHSVASFIFNEDKNVQTWLPKDLDQLLKHGDWPSVNYWRRDEIPNAVWLNGRQYEIKIGSSEYGSFESADFPFDVHRLEHLLKKYKYFIKTIGNSRPANSCAIIVGDNELYYVFDPHSRNKKDEVEENTYGHISDSSEDEEHLPEEERRKRYAKAEKVCYNRMVKSGSYGSIKTMLSEIVDNVMNRISIAAEGPSLSSTAASASSCHGGDGASTDVSLIGSPVQSNRGRKRRRENAWKCNIAKARRNVGKDYVSKKGKHVRERKVKAGCGIECRRKCHSVINEGERQLFHGFWQLGCVDKQREYLDGVVIE
ncbi:scavenger receptor sr-c-like protein, partial [Plakobranchus ocellatus]